MSGKKISVDSELYEQLKQCSEAEGYATPEEFALHVLEKAVDRFHGGAAEGPESLGNPESEVPVNVVQGNIDAAPAGEDAAPARGGEERLNDPPAPPDEPQGVAAEPAEPEPSADSRHEGLSPAE